MNCEILYVQAGFRNGRGTRDEIANIHWIIKKKKKQKNSRNTPTSALSTMQRPLTVGHNKLWKTCRLEYQTILPSFWEIWMQVKKQQLELNMEQQAGSKLGKEYVKAVYFWESQILGRLIRSPGVPKERGVWNSQGGRKDIFLVPLCYLGLYNNNVFHSRIVSGTKPSG